MKIIMQAEAAECGLASVAMIANHHDYKQSLNSLRQQFPQSLKGMNLKQIIDIAGVLNFNCRALKLSLEEVSQLNLPCIAHFDLNHFVVLSHVSSKGLTVFDPAKGKLTMPIEVFAEHFTGVALELTPSESFQPQSIDDTLTFKQVLPHFRGLTSILIQILIMSLMLQVFLLIMPMYMQTVIDDVLVSFDQDLLFVLATGFTFIVLFQQSLQALRGFAVIHLGNSVAKQLTEKLFTHLMSLPLSFFESRHVADVISRFQSVEQIKRMVAQKMVEAFIDGLMAVTTLILLFYYHAQLALVVVITICIYFTSRMLWYSPFKRGSEQAIQAIATEQSDFMESVRGIQSIKLMALESKRRSNWLNKFVAALNQKVKLEQLQLKFSISNGLLFGLENILVIYLGAGYVINSGTSVPFTLGMLTAFIAYKTQVTSRFSSLIDTFIEFRMLSLHFQRISDIALTKPDPGVTNKVSLPHRLTGAIHINELSFFYPQETKPIFTRLSLNIQVGESIAIVGKSGMGKSTFLKVLVGLLEHTDGDISFGVSDQPSFQKTSLIGLNNIRQQTACVMQNDSLLSGSIAENIAHFSNPIDMPQVIRCTKLACIEEDILSMPMTYHSHIGEMGGSLSGGQIQRLLLARALYVNPTMLFLDEATSHLDVKTESQINESLKSLEITKIFIAHRVETIKQADRVLELTPSCFRDVTRDFL